MYRKKLSHYEPILIHKFLVLMSLLFEFQTIFKNYYIY